MQIASLALTLLVILSGMSSAQAEGCAPVDAFTAVVELAHATSGLSVAEQAAAFDKTIITRFAPLYDSQVLGIGSGEKRDARIVASLDQIRAGSLVDRTKMSVVELLPKIAAVYARKFADFRCDFPVYLMDGLGQLDGAGRVVAGQRSLVIGIDTLATEDPVRRPVFLAHEFFHRYHYQAAGFSDDPGDAQALWRTLWAEGLATYVSMKLTPDATLSDALILPVDLEARAKPKLPRIVDIILPRLDRVDPAIFKLLFTYGGDQAADAGLPWRSGYYAGYRVAAELSRTRTLDQLAHLRGPALYRLIRQTLAKIRRSNYHSQ